MRVSGLTDSFHLIASRLSLQLTFLVVRCLFGVWAVWLVSRFD